jgi:hypothetical protein
MDGPQSEGKKKELWWQSNKKQEKIGRERQNKNSYKMWIGDFL